MEPHHPTETATSVSSIASKFTGPSLPQPEMGFRSAYAMEQEAHRRAHAEAKQLQHQYRGRGDDLMSEFERNRRLEEMAMRRAELEARNNLHRYNGSHALILALERAKLGLALSSQQQALLDQQAPALNLQFIFSPDQIEAERLKALAEAEAELAAQLTASTGPGTAGADASFMHPMEGAAAGAGAQSMGALPPHGLSHSLAALSLGGTPVSAMAVGSGFHELHPSGAPAAEENPTARMSLGGGRPLPAADAATEAERQKAEEAASLMHTVTAIVQQEGRALALPELSGLLQSRLGRRWGTEYEGRHGSLLRFLKEHGTPGYHIISFNKWISLAGMPVPEPSPSGSAGAASPPFSGAAAAAGRAGFGAGAPMGGGRDAGITMARRDADETATALAQGGRYLASWAAPQQQGFGAPGTQPMMAPGGGMPAGMAFAGPHGYGSSAATMVTHGYGAGGTPMGPPGVGFAPFGHAIPGYGGAYGAHGHQYTATGTFYSAASGATPQGQPGGFAHGPSGTMVMVQTPMGLQPAMMPAGGPGSATSAAAAAPFDPFATGPPSGAPSAAASINPFDDMADFDPLAGAARARKEEQERQDAAAARAAEDAERAASGSAIGSMGETEAERRLRRMRERRTASGRMLPPLPSPGSSNGSPPQEGSAGSAESSTPLSGEGDAFGTPSSEEVPSVRGLSRATAVLAGSSARTGGSQRLSYTSSATGFSGSTAGRRTSSAATYDGTLVSADIVPSHAHRKTTRSHMSTSTESAVDVAPDYALQRAAGLTGSTSSRGQPGAGRPLTSATSFSAGFGGVPAGAGGRGSAHDLRPAVSSAVSIPGSAARADASFSDFTSGRYPPSSGRPGSAGAGGPGLGASRGYGADVYGEGRPGVGPRSSSFDVEALAQKAVDRGLCDGDDNLSWQDFDVLFRPILQHFTLYKHGRKGGAKRHHFWMNTSLTRLYWDTTKLMDLMKTGERHIEMADVVALIDGVGTDLLRKKVGRGEVAPSHQDRCFSLVTTSRTFDLQAQSSAQRKVLVRAFNFLIKKLNRGTSYVQTGAGGGFSSTTGISGGGSGMGRPATSYGASDYRSSTGATRPGGSGYGGPSGGGGGDWGSWR